MRSDHRSRVSTTGTVTRRVWIVIVPLLAAGCATPRNSAANTTAQQPPLAVAAEAPTKLVETRYDVRGYREVTNPKVRHEAHAVYRSTRVSMTANEELITVPRSTYPTASYAPLPASDELAAELAAQKAITGDLRAMQTSMVETEGRMQVQYAMLVRESAEALKVHEQLEADRARLRGAPPVGTAASPAGAPAGNPSEVKW